MTSKENRIMLDFDKDRSKISSILQKLPIFVGLSPEEFEHINKICIPVTIPGDETIFMEGEDSTCMYALLFGTIQLRTQSKGIIHTVKPGEVFGEIGFISQQKRTASAVADGTSILLKIDTQAFQTLLDKYPRISFIIMRNITLGLADHINRMNKANSLEFLLYREDF
jgi:CRP-like cAMP-binding protein